VPNKKRRSHRNGYIKSYVAPSSNGTSRERKVFNAILTKQEADKDEDEDETSYFLGHPSILEDDRDKSKKGKPSSPNDATHLCNRCVTALK
jgi:hypothetical protein